MKLILTALLSASSLSLAADASVQFRVSGLFQPDRVADLRRQAAEMTDAKLESVDYDTAVVSFRYDADTKPFKAASPEQVLKQLNESLRKVSKGAFVLRPLSPFPIVKWEEVRIGISGLDCKGCAFYAHNAVCDLDGVERVTASFKDSLLIAWIDPSKTNRDTLQSALKKREVKLAELPTAKATN